MRQLLPEPVDDVDPAALYAADRRPAQGRRPWVLVNMITSTDGAIAVDGRSGPLGGPADKRVFRALRGVAGTILVGAGTVRAERYGPARLPGGRPGPPIAVVTRTGELDPGLRLFAEADPSAPPIVLTCRACPPDRLAALERVADVVVAGDATVDLGAALALLAGRGVDVVVAEGGPSLNGELLAGGLVDEWCLTLAPLLVGGRSRRAVDGPPPVGPLVLVLDRLLEEDGFLFARYVRADAEL